VTFGVFIHGVEQAAEMKQKDTDVFDVDTGKLSPAEREVARDAVDGRSNAEIAQRRGRTVRTIANQLASIYRKLGVGSRAELAVLVERFESGNPHAVDPVGLSERERAIGQLAARGKSNKLIAYELGLAESTVGTHLSAVMRKLGCGSRVELIRMLAGFAPHE
jgi:DNA-binding NarL/FixJ family response regulator